MNLNQVTLPANDVQVSIDFYQSLGFKMIVDAAPNYARFECPDGESTFSLHHSNASSNLNYGAVVYFECTNLDFTVQQLQSRGINFDQMPEDQPWLWREARLLDPSKNALCLYSAGNNRKNPPWRIQEPS